MMAAALGAGMSELTAGGRMIGTATTGVWEMGGGGKMTAAALGAGMTELTNGVNGAEGLGTRVGLESKMTAVASGARKVVLIDEVTVVGMVGMRATAAALGVGTGGRMTSAALGVETIEQIGDKAVEVVMIETRAITVAWRMGMNLRMTAAASGAGKIKLTGGEALEAVMIAAKGAEVFGMRVITTRMIAVAWGVVRADGTTPSAKGAWKVGPTGDEALGVGMIETRAIPRKEAIGMMTAAALRGETMELTEGRTSGVGVRAMMGVKTQDTTSHKTLVSGSVERTSAEMLEVRKMMGAHRTRGMSVRGLEDELKRETAGGAKVTERTRRKGNWAKR
eukprot:Sspe_Gene.24877::Locus_9917_Transcript_1_1_Confidence_1.000_Length_1782::g.24877::m.24877